MRRLVILLYICNFLYPCVTSQYTREDLYLKPCQIGYFECDDGECIQEIHRCNGFSDCKDDSDERNCDYIDDDVDDDYDILSGSHASTSKCGNHEYACKSSRDCIPAEKFCDMIEDCLDGSDEYDGCVDHLDCGDRFRCSDGHCVFKKWVCDGSKDCPDNSDEWNCRANKTSSPKDCKTENSQYLCENQRCIALNAVCNKKDDCGDGSDEGPACISGCPSSIKCDHECKQTPKGSICLCKPGYKLQNNNTCIDIDECQTYGICDQECVNSPGSYSCRCQTDYFLLADMKTCKARAGEATLLFSTKTEIHGMYVDSKVPFKLASHLSHVVAVAMNGNYLYWSDVEEEPLRETIVRSISRRHKEDIVTTGLSRVTSIAVDWITENIYFTDKKHVAVCTNDGTYCTVLVSDTVSEPTGIALLPTRGKMYWGKWNLNYSHIVVAGMDGKNIRIFVSENLGWPKSMTIDYPTDRLYWLDAKLLIIESIRLDGTDRRVVLHDIIQNPHSLAVFENKLYWSDLESKTIESCDKFTGKDWNIVFRVTTEHQSPYNVHIDHSATKPKIDNPCHPNPCSQLCMLNQDKGYTCACTPDKELNADKHTCEEVKQNQHLLIVDGNTAVNYYYGLLGKPETKNLSRAPSFITELMSDPISGQVLMCNTELFEKNVKRYDPVSGIFEDIMSVSGIIKGIAFDHIGNNLYVTYTMYKFIKVHNVKTQAMTVFYFKDPISSIALAPEESKMYVTFEESGQTFPYPVPKSISLYEMNMNGLGERKLLGKHLVGPQISMYYDSDSKTLFVGDEGAGSISSYSAKGKRLIRTGLNQPMSLTVAGDNIFWTERNSKALYWANHKKNYHPSHVVFQMPTTIHNTHPYVITLRKDAKQDHGCQKNNGNCSDVCLPSFITSFICACPPGMALSSDNRTCTVQHLCNSNEYKCSEHNMCIEKKKLCDGIPDCPNGEDETVDCAKKGRCEEDQFMCKNGDCISSKSRCNSHYDCTDQSDEENCEKPECKSDEFQCGDGTCISNTKVCDGYPHCNDFSDELNCKSVTCSPKQFACPSPHGRCISMAFVCDGEADCLDGEDESPKNCMSDVRHSSCQDGDFRCSNGNCISPSLQCDGTDDCHDGTDERHCLGGKLNYLVNCTVNEYRCHHTSTCLPKTVRCNGVNDCPRHDDEHNCAFCFEDEFACDNMKCIPESWVCDKTDDCGDNSDENNCDGGKKIIKESDYECDEFKCSVGTCLPYSKVCDGIRNCPDGSDENGKCQTACVADNFCKGICYKTPLGAVCGCRDGYRLAVDAISCEDINECKQDVCSQICQNTVGSYECSCYEKYIIRNDKVSCKAVGPAMEFITVTDSDIRMISSNLHSVEMIHSLSGLSVSGLDVNAVDNSVYWSNDEFGTIKKLNIKTKKITTVMIAEHPQALAVDWVTDNIYVNDNGRPNTIKVCNLEKQICATLIKIEDKAKVGSLLVDSINRWLFWAQITWQMDKPFSKICRTDMMGSDMKIISSDVGFVSGLTIDHIKSKLYWSDNFHKTIESSNLDGSQRSVFLNTDKFHPLGISIYEQSLYWLMGTNGQLKSCKLYGTKSCEMINMGTNNVHRQFTILHISRQPVVKNPCDEEYCDYMCVLKDNATCICSDGKPIKSNSTCTIDVNELKFIRNPSRNTRNLSGIYSVTIIVLLIGVLLLCVYYYYQKNKNKLKPKSVNDLSCSGIRFQNPSYDRRDEVEVILNTVVSDLSPGQHEYVNPVDDQFLSMKAAMENSKNRQISDQCSDERDIEETKKQDTALIQFVHSK